MEKTVLLGTRHTPEVMAMLEKQANASLRSKAKQVEYLIRKEDAELYSPPVVNGKPGSNQATILR